MGTVSLQFQLKLDSFKLKLETYDFTSIHTLFSDFLQPFSFLNSSNCEDISSIAKKFLPFLNQSLTLLPKRLSESPKHPKTTEFVSQLLDCYKLCLDCLDVVAPQLSLDCKSYCVHLQRGRYVHCLMRWQRYEDAINEGFRVLEDLGVVKLLQYPKCKVSKGNLVPSSDGRLEDEFVHLIVNLAVAIAQCVSLSSVKDAGTEKYTDLLDLIAVVRPWFRHLEASARTKLQWKLVTHMKTSALFLVREVANFEKVLARFCADTFDEYIRLLDARSQQGTAWDELEEFVNFVSKFTNKCRSACKDIRFSIATHLYNSKFSQDLANFKLIQQLHALGLYFFEFRFEPNSCLSSASKSSTPSVGFLPEGWDKLQHISALLSFGKNYYTSNSEVCDEPESRAFWDFDEKESLCLSSKASKFCKSINGEAYLSFYLDALKFLCWPLAEFVTSERKRIVTEDMEPPLGNALKLILEPFLEYSLFFPYCQQNGESRADLDMVVLSISVATVTLSLKLNSRTKGSTRLINYIISNECIPLLRPQMWKHTISMLHNNFVVFYKLERVNEALEALEISCRASWSRCILFSEILTGKQKGFDEELSENKIAEYVNEACKVNSLLMDILHQIDSCKVVEITKSGLEKWCLARKHLGQLPCPVVIIKHWAKIQCKMYKKIEGSAPVLGKSLLDSPGMTTEIVGTILEQELLVYQEMSNVYPIFCQRMQMEIIDFLLQEVYHSSEYMQRSIILVKKGMLSRTFGIEGLKNCIQCLSNAIKSTKDSSRVTHGIPAKVFNQLAVVYCLRALSTQEANPTSKEIFEDIREAVKLWLSTDVTGRSIIANSDMKFDYLLLLLYHVADLLSIKGDMTLHSDVVNLTIKLLKEMNVPLKKCLLSLWESRRVNHALCAVPVNEGFIKALSKHYDSDAESLDFWIASLKDSQPLSVGLQQNFSFLSSVFPLAFHQLKHSLHLEISDEEVKEVASNLISNVSVSRSSVFQAGYIYHDLSERLIVVGRTIEALFCAKEAHRLRGKLLQQHFSFLIQQHEENDEKLGETTSRKPSACVSQFSVLNQVALRHWPSNNISQDSDDFLLTPWNVLRCYLESTLQVGIVHERLGNVAEAEAQFILGKSISCLQSLPRFIVSFSSCLGKVYHGMSLLDLAQKELETSMQVLSVERDFLTCSRCSLVLESCINEQLGNLYRKGVDCASGNPYESSLLSLISLEKDDLAIWLEGASSVKYKFGEEFAIGAESGNKIDNDCAVAIPGINILSRPAKTKAKTETKRSRKTKKELETLVTAKSCAAEQNSTVTCSRKLSSRGSKSGFVRGVLQNATNSYSNSQLEGEATIASNKITCQKCLSSELKLFGSFTCFIRLKWEFVRRQHVLRLLIGLGKCQGALAGTHRLHIIYAKCMSILLGGNDCDCSSSNLLELASIGKEIPGDNLAVERAKVLYDLCWFSWKALYSEGNGSSCCELCCIQMPHVVSFLMLSFVLSREVPVLFQKVSRLLALIHVVSASRKNLPSLSPCKGLSENYWAAYFHQASVGVHHNLQLLSAISVKHRSQMVSKNKGYEAAVETSMIEDMCTLLRMVPKSTEEIESYVAKFFENLPSATIVCMSLLGASYAGLLEDLMCYPSGVHGWILLSHLSADSQPAVLLLPLSKALQDEETGSSCSTYGEKIVQEWCSPWGCNSLVDDVAPLFKSLLRGNCLSCSSFPEEHTERSRKLWWTCRDNLDKRLQKLLREIEETWFGQWKFMLLGRWLDGDSLNCAVKEFMHEREKDECKWDSNESILKVVMGGIKSVNMEKARIPKLFLEKGCYIGSVIDCDRGRSSSLDKAYDAVDYLSDSLIAAVNKVELEYCTRREPVVFVLDSDVQMLPLENMPIMREQEVYRMPSVTSIFMALQRRSVQEEAAGIATKFPLIDPLDAFYLLNPSGDLSRTQTEFEEFFKHQNMQGMAGIVPSTEDLSSALENRDLFLYFGHGSGAQYIPREKIQKLESCAAMLLMGCSSGSLNLNGCYAPVGTSLSYLLAGAPIVVANLWEVTDLDIDRFAKAMLKSFLEERSMSSTGCIQCSLLAEEIKSMTVKERKRNSKKGRGKKKIVDPMPDVGAYCFKHKLRAGYFVSQARKACKLPFLIGAAPVCYGVPTGITKKRDI